jgi:hypothetical protein
MTILLRGRKFGQSRLKLGEKSRNLSVHRLRYAWRAHKIAGCRARPSCVFHSPSCVWRACRLVVRPSHKSLLRILVISMHLVARESIFGFRAITSEE